MRRRYVILLATMLVATACAGGEAEPSASPTPAQDTTEDGTEPSSLTQPADVDGGATTPPPTEAGGDDDATAAGEGPSTATVTIGDETYAFSSEGAAVAQCLPDLFGIFALQLPMVDDNGAPADGFLGIVALHEGTDPAEVEQISSVHMTLGDVNWVADPEDVRWNGAPETAAMSYVATVEVNDSTLRGTASFVVSGPLQEETTITGTFEATCGEERTS